MRKCWKCTTTLKNNESICPACGAGQEITEDLVNATKSGSQEAMAQIFMMTNGLVYATVRSIVATEEDAEDLLQDTYVQAFQTLDTLNEPKAFYGWIKTIARNLSINYVQKKKPIAFSQMEGDDDDKEFEVKDEDTVVPDIPLEQEETAALLKEMISDLKDELRVPLIMYYYDEMSVKDIAAALNVSESTIKNRLFYARKKLSQKAADMEKRGISLRGLAPVSFLLLLLKNVETHASAASACEAVISAASSAAAVNSTVATGTAQSTATTVGKAVTKESAKALVKKGTLSLQAKLIAGAVAIAAVSGGAYVGVQVAQQNQVEVAEANEEDTGGGNKAEDKYITWADLSVELQEELITGAEEAAWEIEWGMNLQYAPDAEYEISPYAVYIQYYEYNSSNYCFGFIFKCNLTTPHDNIDNLTYFYATALRCKIDGELTILYDYDTLTENSAYYNGYLAAYSLNTESTIRIYETDIPNSSSEYRYVNYPVCYSMNDVLAALDAFCGNSHEFSELTYLVSEDEIQDDLSVTTSNVAKANEEVEEENPVLSTNVIMSSEYKITDDIKGSGGLPSSISEWTVLGSDILRLEIFHIVFQDTLENMPSTAWDVSANQDGSVMAWTLVTETEKSYDGKSTYDWYTLYIAGDGGVAAGTDLNSFFAGYINLRSIEFNDCFYTDNVTDMSCLFHYCYTVESLDLSSLNTENVTDMSYMFFDMERLTSLNVSGFDTSNVTGMKEMFGLCASLTDLDVSSFDTSKVTDMYGMFEACYRLKSLDLSNFNTSSVTDMCRMFRLCEQLKNLDVSGFDTSNVTDMSMMFCSCSNLEGLDISNFGTSNADTTDMFLDSSYSN